MLINVGSPSKHDHRRRVPEQTGGLAVCLPAHMIVAMGFSANRGISPWVSQHPCVSGSQHRHPNRFRLGIAVGLPTYMIIAVRSPSTHDRRRGSPSKQGALPWAPAHMITNRGIAMGFPSSQQYRHGVSHNKLLSHYQLAPLWLWCYWAVSVMW